jgi:hypothetical protein
MRKSDRIVSVVNDQIVSAVADSKWERDSHMTQSAMMMPGQRMKALERANEVRLARAELKRRIAYGDVAVAEVILECPWAAKSWSVGDLLMSQRRWGSIRCRKFLSRNQINEKKPLGQLTDRQRRMLAGQLGPCTGKGLETSEDEVCDSMEIEPCASDEFDAPRTQELELVGV